MTYFLYTILSRIVNLCDCFFGDTKLLLAAICDCNALLLFAA